MSLRLRLLRGLLRLDRLRTIGGRTPSVAAMRGWSERVARSQPGWPHHINTRWVEAAGVPCLWVEPPAADPRKTLFYLHGGGYMLGSVASTHRGFAWRLAQAAGCRMLGVDYRLAPEHPFPAALDDAVRAWRWITEDQGVDASRIVLGGDSAGGGLAYGMLLPLRAQGAPMPAAVITISPWTDLALTGATLTENRRRDPMIPIRALRSVVDWYLAGGDPRDPRASPLYGDLQQAPPSLILAGDSEVLLDDARRLAIALADGGSRTVLRVWPLVPHAWPVLSPTLPESRQAIELCARYLANLEWGRASSRAQDDREIHS